MVLKGLLWYNKCKIGLLFLIDCFLPAVSYLFYKVPITLNDILPQHSNGGSANISGVCMSGSHNLAHPLAQKLLRRNSSHQNFKTTLHVTSEL